MSIAFRDLGLVFNFRSGCVHAMHLYYFETKLPNLKLKTRPKQLLGSLPLDIAPPKLYQQATKTESIPTNSLAYSQTVVLKI
jgi:hypothetical protein